MMDKATIVRKFLDDQKSEAVGKLNDIDEVVSFVGDCIDKLQSMTNFEIYSREINVLNDTFNVSCEMEGDEYGFVRVYAQFDGNDYYASLTYIDDNHEIVDSTVSVKKKSTIISKMQAFVDNVEQKIGK